LRKRCRSPPNIYAYSVQALGDIDFVSVWNFMVSNAMLATAAKVEHVQSHVMAVGI
jgi:hypothetical protein